MSIETIQLFTIGSGGKSAKQFFTLLNDVGVSRIIDVRLFNTSQLAGYTKSNDLAYFVRAILNAEYQHAPILAPTTDILNGYKNGIIDWATYQQRYTELLEQRQPQRQFPLQLLNKACLLCAEPTADNCHRRLASEYFQVHFPELRLAHL